jgi:acyl dehydratase
VIYLDDLSVGDAIGSATYPISRDTLVRYAAASGDFNPIHYNDAVATGVGLPGVIAHGMATMGIAVNLVVDWAGNPADVCEYSVRFTNPIPVPAEGDVALEVSGSIGAIDAESGSIRVDLVATVDGTKVLGRARAVVSAASRPLSGDASDGPR